MLFAASQQAALMLCGLYLSQTSSTKAAVQDNALWEREGGKIPGNAQGIKGTATCLLLGHAAV